MKVFSASQIYEADRQTLYNQNITSFELMERAGKKAFDWLHTYLSGTDKIIHIFCGVGNNGGDGMVIGRFLHIQGYSVKLYIVNYTDKWSEDFRLSHAEFERQTFFKASTINKLSEFPAIGKKEIVIDSIFGIGINRPIVGWLKQLIHHLNQTEAIKIAIDIPSGLFPDKANMDMEAIFKADYTLTFQVPKFTFFLPSTAPFVAKYKTLNIELDEGYLDKAQPLACLIDKQKILEIYKPRPKFSHKGTFGHALIIGGSYGKIGAAVLATEACLRSGAGLVTAFIPRCGYSILQTAVPEAMVFSDKENDYISNIVVEFEPSAVGIGVGMGKNVSTHHAFLSFLKNVKVPLVIDADALNILAENEEALSFLPKNTILTPHPGELRRLIGKWENDDEKIEKTMAFSQKHDVIVVIKGAYTLVVDRKRLFINTSGNPGMATAGSGDVLTGMLTAFLSQGYDYLSATILGVYLHGRAADSAVQKIGHEGIIAGDIIKNIGRSFKEL
ncbi:MAG TPA: NAD(P)H-hydrate dehydratase [Sphingobacterium sp.]|nr:NAD(P)H-hydrate dehydratase [Sphingobacterium sp.]